MADINRWSFKDNTLYRIISRDADYDTAIVYNCSLNVIEESKWTAFSRHGEQVWSLPEVGKMMERSRIMVFYYVRDGLARAYTYSANGRRMYFMRKQDIINLFWYLKELGGKELPPYENVFASLNNKPQLYFRRGGEFVPVYETELRNG